MSAFPTRILLATDGSKEATLAARTAAELSRSTDSELHLVYVMPEPASVHGYQYYSEEMREEVLERAEEEARAVLEVQKERVEAGGGSVTRAHLGQGRPDAEIIGLAEGLGAGLIVLGGRGMSGVRHALMGSVSDFVVRHARLPVLVVRADEGRRSQGGRPIAGGATRVVSNG